MGTIIPLHDNAHEEAQQLLPWYANGSLEESERTRVAAHLAECEECRADLELQRMIGMRVAGTGPDVERGWADMQARIKAAGAIGRPRWFRSRVSIGWAVGIQAMAAALIVAVMLPGRPAEPPATTYHTLGSARPGAAAGNLIVMFGERSDEREIRGALQRSGVRVVDGPTDAGAWVLHVADADRSRALERLRHEPSVTLAEPIDPTGSQ